MVVAVALLLGCAASTGNSGVDDDLPVPTDDADPAASSIDGAAVLQPGQSWEWYLGEGKVTRRDVDVYNVDLFETSAAEVAELHAEGAAVICYISAGTVEDWRPDASEFPDSVVGQGLPEWEGENYLDISRLDLVGPVLAARIELCAAKGFDGIEADNVDVYDNESGFELTRADGKTFIQWLSAESRDRGLLFGLKNVPELVDDLVDATDFAITEDCLADDWCDEMTPLAGAGIAIYAAEYTDRLGELGDDSCTKGVELGLSISLFDRDLDGSVFEHCDGRSSS